MDKIIALCALVIKQLRFTCGGWTDAMRRFATDLAAPSRVTSVGPWPRTARRCCRSLSRKLSAPGGCALSGEYFSGNDVGMIASSLSLLKLINHFLAIGIL